MLEKPDYQAFSDKAFAFRRDQWMRNLMISDLPSGAKVVGLRLALYMNGAKEFAHPPYDKLGSACNLSARQAQTHVFKLEEARWLFVEHVRNRGNRYRLRYWWDE